jgi:hypothetical protein
MEFGFTSLNGTPAIETTVKHAGAAALRITNTGAQENYHHQFTAAQGKYWIRHYIYFDDWPTTNSTTFLSLLNSANAKISARVSASGAIDLFNAEDSAVIGSASSALSLDTWYRLEIGYDSTTLSATTVEARLYAASDEATLLWNPSGTINITADPNRMRVGPPASDATLNMVWDDAAINGDAGSYENSWPGEGSLIILRPSAAGDNAAWARGGTDSGANWSQTEEVPPDNVTTYVQSNTATQIDDYNLEATPSAVASGDTIKWVGVGARFAISALTGGDPDFVVRLKSGANVDESANLSGAGSTSYTSLLTATPKIYPPLGNDSNYEEPGTATPWTKALLDAAQAGIRETVTDTHFVRMSALWVYVEYAPAAEAGAVGDGAATLAGVTLAGTATVPVDADGAVTLAGVTVASGADVPVSADGAATLAGVALAATADVLVDADGAATLAGVTISGTATVGTTPVSGDGAVTLDGVAIASDADVLVSADGTATLDGVTLAGAANIPVDATGTVSLEGVSIASAADVPVDADGAVTLAGVTLAGTGVIGTPPVSADGAVALAGVSLASDAGVAVDAGGAVTLAGVSLLAAGDVPVGGDGAVALGGVSLAGAGVVTSAAQLGSVEVEEVLTATVALSDALAHVVEVEEISLGFVILEEITG